MDGQRIIDGLEDALAYMNGSATKEDYEIHGKPPLLTPSKPTRYNLSRRKVTTKSRSSLGYDEAMHYGESYVAKPAETC